MRWSASPSTRTITSGSRTGRRRCSRMRRDRSGRRRRRFSSSTRKGDCILWWSGRPLRGHARPECTSTIRTASGWRRGDKEAHIMKFTPQAVLAADRTSGKGQGSNDSRTRRRRAHVLRPLGQRRSRRRRLEPSSDRLRQPRGACKRHGRVRREAPRFVFHQDGEVRGCPERSRPRLCKHGTAEPVRFYGPSPRNPHVTR